MMLQVKKGPPVTNFPVLSPHESNELREPPYPSLALAERPSLNVPQDVIDRCAAGTLTLSAGLEECARQNWNVDYDSAVREPSEFSLGFSSDAHVNTDIVWAFMFSILNRMDYCRPPAKDGTESALVWVEAPNPVSEAGTVGVKFRAVWRH